MTDCFHRLDIVMRPPGRMTNPFFYTPHPLCQKAMREVEGWLADMSATDKDVEREIAKGKMVGVLIVRKGNGETGFLAAFSGQIGDRDTLPGFVPPVFSYLAPDGYFKTEEAAITDINRRISSMEQSSRLESLRHDIALLSDEGKREMDEYRAAMADAKARRDERRTRGNLDRQTDADMIRESQFMKAELRRIKQRWKDVVAEKEAALADIVSKIECLRNERRQRSDSLQQWLFSQFVLLNARGESRSLTDIFRQTPQLVPPSGSGECCEPRLLQYAFANGYKPLCMAMMWLGESPRSAVRLHGNYYPACQGRCRPILEWMMQGLDVEPCHIDADREERQLKVLYSDNDIAVVCKPAGMPSVPGKGNRLSVLTAARQLFPNAEGPVMVHRLDMDTSGVMVLALNTAAYHNLQRQFACHTIQKRYVALLAHAPSSISEGQHGVVSLPLSSDYMHRPCQCVDMENGKCAITRWVMGKGCRMELFPETGRTHQLRLHCAHRDGIGVAIKGDTLYGTPSDRLYLHAESIGFLHPSTGTRMHFTYRAEDTSGTWE